MTFFLSHAAACHTMTCCFGLALTPRCSKGLLIILIEPGDRYLSCQFPDFAQVPKSHTDGESTAIQGPTEKFFAWRLERTLACS